MAVAWMNEAALVEDILHEDGSVLIGDVKLTFGMEKVSDNNDCKQNNSQVTNKQRIGPISSEACQPPNATEGCEEILTNLTNMNSGETLRHPEVCTTPVYWKYDGILLSLAYNIGK